TVIITVSLAFAGYIATYINARILARKKDRLELVNKRLNEFYGPLYLATRAGHIAYHALMEKLGKNNSIFERGGPSQRELEEWFLWMKAVFMPLNNIVEKIIIEKAYLIIEEEMPECLLQFFIHVVGYKAVLAKWEKGDFAEKFSIVAFPIEVDEYA